jgi:CPA2 family monovalent cation:H+ antiporter-2
VFVFRRLRIPAVAGYLVVGVAFGPGALGLVSDGESIEAMAEIGVLFLLFTTGLKFSLEDLGKMRLWVFGAGGLQVLITLVVMAVVGPLLGVSVQVGALFGCLIALSSTSVVAKLLEERGDLSAPHGRYGMSLLLFQDLAVVPMVLLLPLLAGADDTVGAAMLGVGETLLTLVGIFVAARFIYPWIMDHVVRAQSRELFTLTTVSVALGTAFLVGKAGVSLELGAFLAGIVVSETEYGREILDSVTPLRDVFSSLFFVSIGMLVTPVLWVQEPLLTLGLAVAVMLGKAILIGGLALVFGFSLESALLAGLGLAQLGEFSFILAREAMTYDLLHDEWYQIFLSVTVLSMTLTPLLMLAAPRLARRLQRRGLGRDCLVPEQSVGDGCDGLRDHVIIVGFGLQGQSVARVLGQIGVPYVAVEMNPLTVRSMRAKGTRIMFGDAGRDYVLRHARVDEAKVLVSSVPDPARARQVVSEARRLNPDLFIVARARYLGDVEPLSELGADEVLPEEFETAIEMVGRVMETYGVPPRAVEREQDFIRREHYSLLRSAPSGRRQGPSLRSLLKGVDVEEVTLTLQSPAVGRSLRELELRARTGVTILGIERGEHLVSNPSPDEALLAGDVLILFGTGEGVTRATELLLRADEGGE